MDKDRETWLELDGDMDKAYFLAKEVGASRNAIAEWNRTGLFPAKVARLYDGLELHGARLVKGYGVQVPGSGAYGKTEWMVARDRQGAMELEERMG